MGDRPDFPTMEQVQKASVEDLARWYRFLPVGDTREQQEIMDSITDRLKKKGGINENGDIAAAVSNKIGYGGV